VPEITDFLTVANVGNVKIFQWAKLDIRELCRNNLEAYVVVPRPGGAEFASSKWLSHHCKGHL